MIPCLLMWFGGRKGERGRGREREGERGEKWSVDTAPKPSRGIGVALAFQILPRLVARLQKP